MGMIEKCNDRIYKYGESCGIYDMPREDAEKMYPST